VQAAHNSKLTAKILNGFILFVENFCIPLRLNSCKKKKKSYGNHRKYPQKSFKPTHAPWRGNAPCALRVVIS
jgi:hypothetical protein